MKLPEMQQALVTIVKYLRAKNIDPIVYGSVGVSFYLGAYKDHYSDIDLLIDGSYMNDRWPELIEILDKQGFQLIDKHEHEFSNGHTVIAFAAQQILSRDHILDNPQSDLVKKSVGDCQITTLSRSAFVKAYEFSSRDGYRKNHRQKKDDQVVALLNKV